MLLHESRKDLSLKHTPHPSAPLACASLSISGPNNTVRISRHAHMTNYMFLTDTGLQGLNYESVLAWTHTHTQRGRPSTPRRVPVSCVVKIYMTRWQTDSGGAAILPISLLMLTALLLWLCKCICICACPHSDKCGGIKENFSKLRLWVNSRLNASFELFFLTV